MDLRKICDSVDKWQENAEIDKIDSCKTQISADGNLLYHES